MSGWDEKRAWRTRDREEGRTRHGQDSREAGGGTGRELTRGAKRVVATSRGDLAKSCLTPLASSAQGPEDEDSLWTVLVSNLSPNCLRRRELGELTVARSSSPDAHPARLSPHTIIPSQPSHNDVSMVG